MWAQTATVRGTVVDADTDAPLVGVNVVLRGADVGPVGRATGGAGTFQFDALPAGRYVLTSSFLGYAPARDTLDLAGGQARVIRVRMQPRDEALAELVVEAETREPDLGRAVGLTSIRPGAIDRVPLPDVNGDLMAVLVTMPGVVSAGDRGGQLFVRGGTPSENLVLVDGIPVYQPFHIVGFYSAFPSDILSQADVYAGGFNARYGGRLSSVIDVSTRNGSKSSYAGAVS
ncbi:MAG: TonB-dependent receptor, partial [Bacteroidota bacterium]